MQDLTIPLLQGAAILAVAGLLRRRVPVLLAAAAALVAGLSAGFPADAMARPPMAVAADLLGVLIGTALGLFVGRPAAGGQGADRSGSGPARRGRRKRRIGRWLAAACMLAAAAAVGVYVEARTVPQWRVLVDGWLGAPTARGLGIPPPRATAGGSAAGAAPEPPVTAATAVRRPPPAGDLRHCLSQASPADVVRCAERAP